MNRQWYTWVHWGSHPAPAKGPFPSIQDAARALDNFLGRHGHQADTWLTAGDVTLRGPFTSRAAARDTDVTVRDGQRMLPIDVKRLAEQGDQ